MSKKKWKAESKRTKKIHLVFDEAKRREFLSGFHKRKLQRKKQAKEKLENELKEERKRLRQEAKESYKNLVVSRRPIPELENSLTEEYEDDDVTVKVVELSTQEIAKRNNWIGPNQLKCDSEYETGNPDNSTNGDEEVPGMELKKAKNKSENVTFTSEKEVKKALKKQATKQVQKSKVFQMKNKIERRKQKKKSLQQKKIKNKLHEKQLKRKRK